MRSLGAAEEYSLLFPPPKNASAENTQRSGSPQSPKKIKIEERKNMLILLPPKYFFCAIMVKEGTKY
jgi:hypothetical protein